MENEEKHSVLCPILEYFDIELFFNTSLLGKEPKVSYTFDFKVKILRTII